MEDLERLRENKQILLTGGTGFFGSHLLPELVSRGYSVVLLKRSFSNTARIENVLSKIKTYNVDDVDIERIFSENKIVGIIHLATNYGKEKNYDVDHMCDVNVRLPTKLCVLGQKYGITFFINTHTSADSKYSLYSAMKNAFIEVAKFFASNYQIKFINMRLEYLYGENDDFSKFIPLVIKSIIDNKEINATGGEQKRDFVYVKDVVNAYLRVLEKINSLNEGFVNFEIGTGKSVSINYFISKIEEEIGQKAKINWGAIPYSKNDIFDSKALIEEAETRLGWYPQYDIYSGLKKTISGYKEELSWVNQH